MAACPGGLTYCLALNTLQTCHAESHNTLCSTQHSHLHSLLINALLHVLYALQTLTCLNFLIFALPLLPVASVLQSGTHSHLTFVTLPLAILSITFL